jgi:glycosyltransferase involved in cell wall biosynthesis
MTPPLDVTHVVLSLDCGGLERFVVNLVRQGQRRGQNVSVMCVERPGTLAPEVESLGARVVCLDKPPGLDRATVRRATAAFNELHPTVVHTHQIGALLYAGPAARRARVPVVVHTEHGNHVKAKTWSRRMRQRALWAWAGRRAARFFCVSDEIAREVSRYGVIPPRKVRVLANGIDTVAFAPGAHGLAVRSAFGIPANAPVVGTIGRLNEVKRQDLLIRGFARVRQRFPESRLLLVGDGPVRNDLEGLVRSLALTDAVHFAGYQAQPAQFLESMDVFALTSRSEGMPLAVLEAWASGLPVVASAVGGLPSLIADGQTGLLFPFPNEGALAAAIEQLLANPDRARQLGRAGQRHVRAHYSLDHVAAEYEDQYRELLVRKDILAAA